MEESPYGQCESSRKPSVQSAGKSRWVAAVMVQSRALCWSHCCYSGLQSLPFLKVDSDKKERDNVKYDCLYSG